VGGGQRGRRALRVIHLVPPGHPGLFGLLQPAAEDVPVDQCRVGHRGRRAGALLGENDSMNSCRAMVCGPSGGRVWNSTAYQVCCLIIARVWLARGPQVGAPVRARPDRHGDVSRDPVEHQVYQAVLAVHVPV